MARQRQTVRLSGVPAAKINASIRVANVRSRIRSNARRRKA